MTREEADAAERGAEESLRDAARLAEALVFASAEPVSAKVLAAKLPRGTEVGAVMLELQRLYRSRGVNLVKVGEGWAFRTAADLAPLLADQAQAPRKLSRAGLEVLAIIAYHQPVTRAEIEEVRGVETSKGTLDVLLELEWVRMRGRRRTPGRPVTYGTTQRFLHQFGLEELRDLPDLEELKGAGLLSPHPPAGLAMAAPPSEPAPDEDPLLDIDLEELGLLTPRPTEP